MPAFEGVIGYYPLNQQSLEDSSSNDLDLVETDDSPGVVYGPIAGDSANKFITRGYVKTNYGERLVKDVSLSFWISTPNNDTDQFPYIYFGDELLPSAFLVFDVSDISNVNVTFGTSLIESTVNIGDCSGDARHIVLIVGLESNQFSLYVDKVLEGVLIGAIADPGLTNRDITVKVQNTSSNVFLNQLVVYNRELTELDIEELFDLSFTDDLALLSEIDRFGTFIAGQIQEWVGTLAEVEYVDTITDDMGTMTGRKVKVIPLAYTFNEPIDRRTDTYDVQLGIIIYERFTSPSTVVRAVPLAWTAVRKRFVEWIFDKLTNARILYNDVYVSQEANVGIVYDYSKLDSNKVFHSEMELLFRKQVRQTASNL